MEKQLITNELLLAFSEYLQSNERAPGTIEKYLRAVSAFRISLESPHWLLSAFLW